VKCLETRTTPEGYKRRRYESAGGLRHTTIEVPLIVWSGINKQGRANNRAAAWTRARGRESKQLQAQHLVAHGWRKAAVAAELGVPLRTVQRWTRYVGERTPCQGLPE
jgi:Homeodomain-like domain